jgi:hypothetical protein
MLLKLQLNALLQDAIVIQNSEVLAEMPKTLLLFVLSLLFVLVLRHSQISSKKRSCVDVLACFGTFVKS